MAHKWRLEGVYRRCVFCAVMQRRERNRDTSYRWYPLVGRCPSTKDGRKPMRREAILTAIRDGRHTPAGIAAHMGISLPHTRSALSLAKKKGHVVNPERGRWELA
jgi:hypothetical protein